MTLFNEFDTILSALKPSQYRKYWRAWNGKADNEVSIKEYIINKAEKIYGCEDLEQLSNFLSSSFSSIGSFVYFRNKTFYDDLVYYIEEELEHDAYYDENDNLTDEGFQKIKDNVHKFIVVSSALYQTSFSEENTYGNTGVKEVYEQLFNGKYRIILPFNTDDANVDEKYFDLYKEDPSRASLLHRFIKDVNYIALLYYDNKMDEAQEGMEKNPAKSEVYTTRYNKAKAEYDAIADFIDSNTSFNTQDVKDYLDGIYRSKSDPKKVLGIAKLIDYVDSRQLMTVYVQKHLSDTLENIKHNFIHRKVTKRKRLNIIISRHPYDIAGMSTGRGWTSCMNLTNGMYRKYVMSSLMNGALIAYLCDANDTNIKSPLGRVLIKPYYNSKDGGLNFKKPNWVLKCSMTYGLFDQVAIWIVQKWLDDNWNKYIRDGKSSYLLDTQAFYNEEEDSEEIS